MGACSSPGQNMLFSDEDLFVDHLRLIHSPPSGTFTRHSSAGTELDRGAWYDRLNVLLEAGKRMGRGVIEEIRCPVPGCAKEWTGKWAWDDRMEHVSRHWEAVARGEEDGGWTEEGGGLLEWAVREGAIRNVEGRWVACGSLGSTLPKEPNDEKKFTHDDASREPPQTSDGSSFGDDDVVLNMPTLPLTREPNTKQQTSHKIARNPVGVLRSGSRSLSSQGKLSVKFVSENQADSPRPPSVKSMTLDYGSDEVPSDVEIGPPMAESQRPASPQPSPTTHSDLDYDGGRKPIDDGDVDALPQTTNPTAPRRRNSGDRRPVRKRLSLFNYRVADPTLVRYRDPDTKETAHPEPRSHPAPLQPPSAMPSTLDNDGEFPDPPPSGLRGGAPLSSVLDDDEDVFTSVDAALDAEDKAPLDEKQISRLKRVFSRRNWTTEKGKGEQKGKEKEKDKGKDKGKDKEDDGGGGGRRRSVLGF